MNIYSSYLLLKTPLKQGKSAVLGDINQHWMENRNGNSNSKISEAKKQMDEWSFSD